MHFSSLWVFSLFPVVLFLVSILSVSEYFWLFAGHSREWALCWQWMCPPPENPHQLCHLPVGSANVTPQISPSVHGRPGSVPLSPRTTCGSSAAMMSQGVCLSFLLPLALFSTHAGFGRALCGYEDGGLVYWYLPLEQRVGSSALPALTSLGPDFCSPPLWLTPWNRSCTSPSTYMTSPCNIHDLGLRLLMRFLGIPCYSF